MKTNSKYQGVVVPMITPVDANGQPDIPAIRTLTGSFAACGISPLLLGTTGEGNSVSATGALRMVQACAEAAQGRITLYVGLTGCCVEEQLAAAESYAQAGADVLVATLPSYYALTPSQMHAYYQHLADNVPLPLMLYNIAATTHMSIPVEVIKNLSNHPNIVGLKDSERDLDRMHACLRLSVGNPRFSYFCGWAAQSAYSLQQGADGIVPSTGNVVPQRFAQLCQAAVADDVETANRLQAETDEIARIYQQGRTLGQSLAALKVMMHARHLCQPWMLPPLTRLPAEEEEKIMQQTLSIKP